jgi:glucokinase
MTAALRVGLDIGATKTLGVVVDESGEILAQARRPTGRGAAHVVETALGVIAALRTKTGERLDGPLGVGIPGLVDTGRNAVKHAVNLGVDGDWFPIGDLLARELDVPVAIDNDVNAASLGAAALTGHRDLVYLSIGTGLAAGFVLDGALRRGEHGAAGEVGHVPVDPGGARCQCGQRGCLETVASGTALAAAWPASDLPPAQSLFAAATAGDPDAIRIRDRFTAGVADAIRLLALTVDPGTFVLGGGVAQLGEALRSEVADALRAQAVASPFLASLDLARRIDVVPTHVPVAAFGAALLAGSWS